MKKEIEPKQIMDLVNDLTGVGMKEMLLLGFDGKNTIGRGRASEQGISTMIKGFLVHVRPEFRKALILEILAEEFDLGGANDDD
ncbi:conserved domain protein [Limosilactobacillus oris F0423]|uniref:Conserved domain protein n=1 Tax=Limosilactobacillus oris F0423 TaxID=944562 RepID=A0ABN0D5V7_9LACO|nr:hypothetical protein [Limosilactobacillus oris]EGS37905.1 conserved domain protein [Limosilactobacillus oris F0423]